MITKQDMIKIAIIVGGVWNMDERKSLAFSFANMLADSNPNFNRLKFLLACNVHSTKNPAVWCGQGEELD